MEISGAVLRRSIVGAGVGHQPDAISDPSSFPVTVGWQRRKRDSMRTIAVAGGGQRFCDEGHLSYYVVPARCGKEEEKKRTKLMKVLSRDLSALCAIGTSFDLPGEVNGNSITEAAKVLLAQLEHLRNEEKEMKRKKKEAKCAKKEAKMKACNNVNESSSSSSESSDSECEEVIDMNNLGTLSAPDPKVGNFSLPPVEPFCSKVDEPLAEDVQQGNKTITDLRDCRNDAASKISSDGCCNTTSLATEKPMDRINGCNEDESSSPSSESSDSECEEVLDINKSRNGAIAVISVPEVTYEELSLPSTALIGKQQTVERLAEDKITMKLECQRTDTSGTGAASATAAAMDKVEVCTGGKCKRNGALELMAEFERKIGMEGAVVGCKCMGKCKQGPNVRVLARCDVNDEVSKNPLCIGVGIEDVGAIVSNFFGDKKDFGGLMAA